MASEFDDDLLALAEPREVESRPRKKKRASNGSPSKRRAENSDSDSGSAMDIESEEEDDTPAQYPLEGKYVDHADRERLLNLPELEREEILSARLEEIQKWKDRQELKNLVKRQTGLAVNDDAGSRRKGTKLDEYNAARKAKAERQQARRDRGSPSSPRGRGRSYSDDDDDASDRDHRPVTSRKTDRVIVIADLERIRLSRRKIAHCLDKPWFKEYALGAYVRYRVGEDAGRAVYRVCKIAELNETTSTYTVEGQRSNLSAELQHGTSKRAYPLSAISDSPFTDREFDRLVATHKEEKLPLPTLRDIETKEQQLKFLENKEWTEEDVKQHLLNKEKRLGGKLTSAAFAIQRGNLRGAMQLAEKRGDQREIAEIKLKINELEINHPEHLENNKRGRDEEEDLVAKVNKRNRLLNEEAIRKAEAAETERKRRERRAKANGGADTPNRNSNNGTPSRGLPGGVSPLPIAPLPKTGVSYESVVKDIEVDLGDF